MIIENLKDGERLINNGPQEMRCTRCGKHVDDLIPFDLDEETHIYLACGKRLIQNFRMADFVDYQENYEWILWSITECGQSDELYKELYEFFGRTQVEEAIRYEGMRGICVKGWECRDCIKEEGKFKHYSDNED